VRPGARKHAEGRWTVVRVFGRLRSFIKEASQELRRVVWPSTEELKGYTYLVVIVILLVAVWIGILEFACLKLSDAVHLYGKP